MKSDVARKSICLALCRLGYFHEELASGLLLAFEDDVSDQCFRDEAACGLAQIQSEECIPRLIKLANSPDEDYQSRSLFIILSHGNPEVLRLMVADPQRKRMNLTEYARGLAGIDNPLGRTYLKELAQHPDESVRKAAKLGLKKAEEWGWLNN